MVGSYISQGYSYMVKISAISADVKEYANSSETDYIVMDNYSGHYTRKSTELYR